MIISLKSEQGRGRRTVVDLLVRIAEAGYDNRQQYLSRVDVDIHVAGNGPSKKVWRLRCSEVPQQERCSSLSSPSMPALSENGLHSVSKLVFLPMNTPKSREEIASRQASRS